MRVKNFYMRQPNEKLQDYLSKLDPVCYANIKEHIRLDLQYSKQVAFLLANVYVKCPNCSALGRKVPNNLKEGSLEYVEFLNSMISYLISTKKDNVLVKEYRKGLVNALSPANLFSPHASFRSNYMKLPGWQYLYNVMKRELFLHLLIDCCGYILASESMVQLFGPSFSFSRNSSNRVSRGRMMYKLQREPEKMCRIFTKSSHDLLNEIVPVASKQKRTPKRLRQLQNVLKTMLINDRKMDYSVTRSKIQGISSVTGTNPSVVAMIVIEILTLIFPSSFWGLTTNRILLELKIEMFITSPRSESMPANYIQEGMSLNSFTWVGRSSRTTSRQDFDSRKNLVCQVLNWLLLNVICRIVSQFWYVTQRPPNSNSDCDYLAFYPHSALNYLLDPWIRKYTLKYLRVSTYGGAVQKGKLLNSGRLRVLPKSDDFRFICVPLRGPEGSELRTEDTYYLYAKNIIGPIRDLLYHKLRKFLKHRLKKHAVCMSNEDVLREIITYKLRNAKPAGGYYMAKFDMTKCYDNLDQGKIMECVRRLFQDDDDTAEYFVRESVRPLSSKNSSSQRRVVRVIESDSVESLDARLINPSRIHSHEGLTSEDIRYEERYGSTTRITKKQVLEFVQEHIRNATVIINEKVPKSYTRTQGVFQGFPLLAVLCHIVYTAMMHDIFGFILDDSKSVLLRVVDDFLLVTSKQDMCFRTLKAARSSEAESYGAFFNSSKSTVSGQCLDEEMHFLGLKFLPQLLEFILDPPKVGEWGVIDSKPLRCNLQILKNHYLFRLRSCISHRELYSASMMIEYLIHILEVILKTMKRDQTTLVLKGDREEQVLDQISRLLLELLYESERVLTLHYELKQVATFSLKFRRTVFLQLASHGFFNPVCIAFKALSNAP